MGDKQRHVSGYNSAWSEDVAHSCSQVGYPLAPQRPPAWIQGLLAEKFFVACGIHEFGRKNEKNIYCLDCCKSICPHCLQAHLSHRLLQVRRYVYHDVIRLGDMEKLIDCSFVQPYTINSAKVIFLNQRPQSRPFKGSGNMCSTCERILQDPYYYCSLACKVNHIVNQGQDLSQYLHKCDTLPLSDFVFTHIESFKGDSGDLDDGQMTPHSILDNPLSSGSSASGTVGCKTVACTATTDHVKGKGKAKAKGKTSDIANNHNANAVHDRDVSAIHASRRKGTPQRSPLY